MSMGQKKFHQLFLRTFLILIIGINFTARLNAETAYSSTKIGNFGLPGIIDLPTGRKLPDGELVITQQVHKYLARTGLSFQLLSRLGTTFRYNGHGIGGNEAYGRVNHDRSFDLHLTLWDEGRYHPAISLGLRDFIGTGWYSSEYIVGTKSLGRLEVTTGLGFGRLAGRGNFTNPLAVLSDKFNIRGSGRSKIDLGGTLGTINWFTGDAAAFGGLRFFINDRFDVAAEYSPDLMGKESDYLELKSPWNFGANYKINEMTSVSAQYLYGSIISLKGNIVFNPKRPPFGAGKELAPVPMRIRGQSYTNIDTSDIKTIKKVLEYDKFKILSLYESGNQIRLDIENKKFRSTAQALGRVTSTLQRFTKNDVKEALIVFHQDSIQMSSYFVSLDRIEKSQFSPVDGIESSKMFTLADVSPMQAYKEKKDKFTWSLGPYFTHRLFDPDLPLSAETGLELRTKYELTPKINFSGGFRKSVLTNLTENTRKSDSTLPKVLSNWPLYDIAGQDGHINDLTISYKTNLSSGIYGRLHAGYLEPFFAGIGGEVLLKPAKSPIAIGLDIHAVKQRDFDMLFDMSNYTTTVGHLSFYLDTGRNFDLEINAGRYLAGDWGATTKISRVFSNGWEVGGYATITDVPFETFGEGSFDKGIFVVIPLDWTLGKPSKQKRRFEIRPITRDGGARLSSARSLYKQLRKFQNAQFRRESGRIWK